MDNTSILRKAGSRSLEDPESFFVILDPGIEWDPSALVPDATVTRGTDAVRAYFREFLRTFDEYGYEWEEMIEVGDEVITVMRSWGKGKGSGVTVESRVAQVWTFRDGRVVRYRDFLDKAAALAAVSRA